MSFQAEHKIQSVKGNLVLEMDQVPKVLRPLVQEWLPDAYIVSFKVRARSLSSLNLLRPRPAPTHVFHFVFAA